MTRNYKQRKYDFLGRTVEKVLVTLFLIFSSSSFFPSYLSLRGIVVKKWQDIINKLGLISQVEHRQLQDFLVTGLIFSSFFSFFLSFAYLDLFGPGQLKISRHYFVFSFFFLWRNWISCDWTGENFSSLFCFFSSFFSSFFLTYLSREIVVKSDKKL